MGLLPPRFVCDALNDKNTAANTPSFSFTLAAKPDYRKNYPEMRINGSGSGTFSIRHRQVDRDGTIFWDIIDAQLVPYGSRVFSDRAA